MSDSAAVLALDVSTLPTHAFGHRSVMWWATMCMIAIEGMAFALAISSYLYLKGRMPHWPGGAPTPGMFWGFSSSQRSSRFTRTIAASLFPRKRSSDSRTVRVSLSFV